MLSACGSTAAKPTSSSSSTGSTSSTTSTTAGPPNSVSSKTASQIVDATYAATTAEKSFQIDETTNQGGAAIELLSNVTKTDGEQLVTITSGKKTGHVETLLVDDVAYFRGDETGLDDFTEFGAARSKKWADTWISVTSSQAGYSDLTSALQVDSAAEQYVKLPGTLTKGSPTSISGVDVFGVNAVDTETAGKLELTMYVQTHGPTLPVEVRGVTTTTSTGGTEQVTVGFSKWGEPVTVTAPTGAVPITTIEPKAG